SSSTAGINVVADDVTCGASQRARREKSSRCSFDYSVLRLLQEGDNLLSRHRREAFEKSINRFACLKIVKQRLQYASCPGEQSNATRHVGVARDNWPFIASDYVSKRATRHNRHVIAAQKGLLLYLHPVDGFPVSRSQSSMTKLADSHLRST